MNHRLPCLSLLLVLSSGCATIGGTDDDTLTITKTSEETFQPVAYTPADGLAAYKHTDKPQKAEWLSCRSKTAARGAILAMHTDREGYEKGKFCAGWIAQTFLSQGFDVIAVNRPGFGASTGAPDFGGPQSMAAIAAGVAEAVTKGKLPKPVVGVWGYDSGASAAGLVSKQLKGLKFLILGGGIYDYEDTLRKTADSATKKDIESLKKTGGDQAVEDRSIAYDVSGLPKVIALYHGKQDSTVPPTQAKAFADSLESSGDYKVTLQIIDGVSHVIPWGHHRKILEILAVSMAADAG